MQYANLLILPLIFLVPGYILYQIFWDKKSKLYFLDFVFLIVLGSILTSGLFGLLLAELGVFSLQNLTLALLFAIILSIVNFRIHLGLRFPKPTINPISGSLTVLVLFAAFLFLKPYPWILGGRDQGVYVNTGVNIANTGSIIIHDSMLEKMSNPSKDVFYMIEKRPEVLKEIKYEGLQFPGFYVTDKDRGEIKPQFFYLYPIWIAIFYSFFGLELSLYLTPIFAIMAVVAVFIFTRTIFKDQTALVATLLLTLNFAQIWYAREPSTEILTQLLLFSGLLTFIAFERSHNRYFGIIAALSFGEALLTRVDSFYFLPPLALYLFYLWFSKKLDKKNILYFILPVTLLSTYAFINAFFLSAPYTFDIIRKSNPGILPLITRHFEITLTLTFLFLLSLLFFARFRSKIFLKLSHFRSFLLYARYPLSIIIIAVVFYSLFIMPNEEIPDSYNFVKLSWYLNGLYGIALAVFGAILLLYKKPYNESYLFLLIMVIYTTSFVSNPRIYPDQPWWIRRFLPVVIPSFLICIAYTITEIYRIRVRNIQIGRAVALLLLITLSLLFLQSDYPLLNHVEYEGAIQHVAYIQNITAADSILLFPNKSWVALKLSTPMNYIFGRKSFIIYNQNYPILVKQIKEWNNEGRKVYFINPSDEVKNNLQKLGVSLTFKEGRYLTVPLMGEGTQSGFPQNITQRRIDYKLFEINTP